MDELSEETVQEIRSIIIQEANSGQLSYGEEVVIHESSQMRKVFVPFFINRTEGTQFACKILELEKAEEEWMIEEDNEISLDETASRNLLRTLQDHLELADRNEGEGEFVVINVTDGEIRDGDFDQEVVIRSILEALGTTNLDEYLDKNELADELTETFRGAIRIYEIREAVNELRTNLSAGISDESVYQDWCERHSWAFGHAHLLPDDWRRITIGDEVDLLSPSVLGGFRDVIELKRPDMDVLNSDDQVRSFYFSRPLSRAIGQCQRYLDALHEEASEGLRDHPEIVAWHPSAKIVIGRSNNWDEEKLKALHSLNQNLVRIDVITYDHLLAMGERMISILEDQDAERINESEVIIDQ